MELKSRNYKLDNAKGILIILVVFAHLIGNILGYGGVLNSPLWAVINTFHMCAFLILSGYLSERRINEKAYDKVLVKIFLPYLFSQFAMFLLYASTNTLKENFNLENTNHMLWLRPQGALWYIWALGIYIIVTSVIFRAGRNWKLVFGISVAIALLAGYFYTIWYFRFTKLLCFYPYFLLGYILSGHKSAIEQAVSKIRIRIAGAVVLVAGLCLAVFLFFRIKGTVNLGGLISMEGNGRYVFHMKDYVSDHSYLYLGPLYRLCLISIAIVISLSFLMIVPGRKSFLSWLGKYSMYIYILHWILIKAAALLMSKDMIPWMNICKQFLNSSYYLIFVGLPFTVLLCIFLASKPLRYIFRPFLEPNINLKKLLSRFQ